MKIYRIAFESPELTSLCKNMEVKYPGLELFVYENEHKVYVSQIRLPKEMQGQGIGTSVMEKIKEFATKVGKPVVLHPEADSRKKQQLENFYRKLDFVHNKGRNRDYKISEPFAKTMYWRPPKVPQRTSSISTISRTSEFLNGWISPYTNKYVEVIKNPNSTEIKSLLKRISFSSFADKHVGIIISGNDVYGFNRDAEYHNNVIQKMNIASPSISGLYYPMDNFFFITDATSKEMQDTPLAYDMVRKKFGNGIEIVAFNEDVVGAWDKIQKDHLVTAQSNNISISLDKYSLSLKDRIDDIAAFNIDEFHRLSEFSFNPDYVINALNEVKYPNIEQVKQVIESKDLDKIHEVIMGIFEWYKQNKNYKLWEKLSPVAKALNDYYDILNGNKITWTDEFCEKFLKENVEKTTSNMKNIEISIRDAISRIKNWNGSRILIEAAPVYKDKEGFDQDSAHITVIGGGGDAGEAGFSYFQMDDKYEIDDVLDAGDTDFFQDDGVQSDYFGLVNSLRNPKMNEEKPKVLTLYTARPVADRNIYEGVKEIPSNIFLTDKYDFAEGFAREYGGKRDIWKVRILNKYLINTMDSSEQKQYQTFGEKGGKFVPVVSIEMITPWAES